MNKGMTPLRNKVTEGSFLFETQGVVPDRVLVFRHFGGDEKKLLAAGHGLKFLWAEVVALP